MALLSPSRASYGQLELVSEFSLLGRTYCFLATYFQAGQVYIHGGTDLHLGRTGQTHGVSLLLCVWLPAEISFPASLVHLEGSSHDPFSWGRVEALGKASDLRTDRKGLGRPE